MKKEDIFKIEVNQEQCFVRGNGINLVCGLAMLVSTLREDIPEDVSNTAIKYGYQIYELENDNKSKNKGMDKAYLNFLETMFGGVK